MTDEKLLKLQQLLDDVDFLLRVRSLHESEKLEFITRQCPLRFNRAFCLLNVLTDEQLSITKKLTTARINELLESVGLNDIPL